MGGTRVVPGHGRISNEIDLVEYRDAMTIIADRITAAGARREDARAGESGRREPRLTTAYTAPRTGPWTTEMFVDAVYREIKANTAALEERACCATCRPTELPFLDEHAAGRLPVRGSPRPRRSRRRKASGDPLEGKWVLNIFASNYEPSSLLPYRREMVITVNGDRDHARGVVMAPAAGQRFARCSTYDYTARFDGKQYPIPNWGNGHGHVEARRREHDRADARRRG